MTEGLPRLTGATFALDLETFDPRLKTHGPGWVTRDGGFIAGVALAWKDLTGTLVGRYWPLRHDGGGNADETRVRDWVRGLVTDTSNTMIVHNRMYDEGWLRWWGVPVRCRVVDTLTAAPLLDEYRRSYSLDNLAKDYLGDPGKIVLPKDTYKNGKGFHNLPVAIARPYAAHDAVLTYRLWTEHFDAALTKEDLRGVFDLETRLLPVLLEMRARGVPVDEEVARHHSQRLRAEEDTLRGRLRRLSRMGRDVAEWEAAYLATVCDKLKIEYPLTAKTKQPSFRAGWLETHPHPFLRGVVEMRRLNKLRTVFVEGYVLDQSVNGIVHGEFHPQRSDDGGAVSGRFSSSHPNLQNLPSRVKAHKILVRGCFRPFPGEEWGAFDYSQQEPRWVVHFASVMGAPGSAAALRAYEDSAGGLDFHTYMAELTGLPRDRAKILNLAVLYGMGGATLCHSLGLPTKWITGRRGTKQEVAGDAGQAIIDQYHANAPFVRTLNYECQRRAKARGYIRTLAGRRCRFEGVRQDWSYKALNRLIQGSSADQIKYAMLAAWDAGHVPLVTVHDELGFSLPDRSVVPAIQASMLDAVECRVPMKIDVDVGPSWGAASQLMVETSDL